MIAESILTVGERAYPGLPAIPGTIFNLALEDSFLAPPQDNAPNYNQNERNS